MRTIVVGAVDSTRLTVEALAQHGCPPHAVFTLPLSLAERHSDYLDLRPVAAAYGVPVIDVADVNTPDSLRHLREIAPDYAFVIGWSQICRREFLSIPRVGCIGFHPAPLPANRGRGVIPWTILQGLTQTGSTVFWLDEGVDSGDILMQEAISLAPAETAATLCAKHGDALQRMLSAAIPLLENGSAPRIRQDHSLATYCAKRRPSDGLIDWTLPADSVWRLIRAVGDPYPGAFSFYRAKQVFVWAADYYGVGPYWGLPGQVQAWDGEGAVVQCGDRKHVVLRCVQVAGGQRVPPRAVFRIHEKLGMDWLSFYNTLQEKISS